MALPSNISTGRVTGQFIVGVVDGPDDDDEPDFIAARGVITFAASTPYLPNRAASPNPVTILKTTIVAVLDSEGYICTPSPEDPTIAGKRGIRLVATDDPDAGVEGWTWKATPRFVNTNGAVIADAVKAFDFALPSGATVDLTTVVKVPASPGIGKEHAFQLLAQAEAAAVVASLAAKKASEDAAVALEVKRQADAGEFKGPQGDKGNPGGVGNPLPLTGIHLDTLLSDNHYIALPTDALTSRGYPVNGIGGHLATFSRNASGFQEYWPASSAQNGSVFYRRIRVNNTWQAWKTFACQRVDTTAGIAVYTYDDAWNREQLIYGDTGYRNLQATASLPSGFTCSGLLIRRVGRLVTLSFDSLVSATDGHLPFFNAPAGFTPQGSSGNTYGNQRVGIATTLDGGVTKVISPDNNTLALRFLSYTKGLSLHGSISYYTSDPWPTTLPGAAAGSVPNL